MKNLPLLLLGAGAVYFIAKKPAKTSTKESLTIAPGQIGSKDIGYKIVDCKLTIYDKQKAFDYAFKLGADGALVNNVDENTWSTKPIKKKLIGDCIASDKNVKILITSKEKAHFIFELFRNLFSGIFSKSDVYDSMTALADIKGFRDSIGEVFGYDVSKYDISLIQLGQL